MEFQIASTVGPQLAAIAEPALYIFITVAFMTTEICIINFMAKHDICGMRKRLYG